MAWLDDRMWCHPKIVDLSDKAFRVYVNSISYSSGMGTSGVLTIRKQQLVGANAKVRVELVEAGLWDELAYSDVRIHDWDEHNGKRDARRAADRERKKSARASAGQSAGRSRGASAGTAHVEGSEGSDAVTAVAVTGAPRQRNELWDALTEVFGEATTRSSQTLRGKVVSSLRAAGATPDEVVSRARSWPRHFDTATLTETALEKHWDALGRKPLRVAQ